MKQINYAGIVKDEADGLTELGRVVRDAWVFGILPETETCTGWDSGRMQGLYEKVFAAWKPHAHLPSHLPAALRERHTRLYSQAIEAARDKDHHPESDGED